VNLSFVPGSGSGNSGHKKRRWVRTLRAWTLAPEDSCSEKRVHWNTKGET
jgi:hypothetical protein